MSVATVRGGIPRVFLKSVDGAGVKHRFGYFTNFIIVRNKGAVPLRIFFTEEDYTGNAKYIDIPVSAATEPHGEWSGPVEINEIWMKSTGAASNIEIVSFQRRG